MEEIEKGCNLCGKCCYISQIKDIEPLNKREIRRIENITGMGREEFTEIMAGHYSFHPYLKYIPDKNN